MASVIEPKASYPVDPDRLINARGSRMRSEVTSGVAGVSSEKYRKIESGKTRTVVGRELIELARSLGVPATALLARDHPSRTGLPGCDADAGNVPTLTSSQSSHVVRAIERVQSGARLQTLTGPRGVGKTTLLMHLRTTLERALGSSVRVVSLLDQCQPWELWRALGVQSIGRDADSGQTRVEVIDALRRENGVLLLDIDGMPSHAAIEQIETIIRYCSELLIIATADRPLGLIGETVEPIDPVRFDPGHASTADDLGHSDAWQLVVAELDRKRATTLLEGERLAELIKLLGMGDGTPQWFVAIGRELVGREPGAIITHGERQLVRGEAFCDLT
ncbi:MAG: AAA family ATPase, partial [Planctomycetota bacterium]